MIRATAWLIYPRDTPDSESMHLIHDNCMTSIIWSALCENAVLAYNGVWCFHIVYQLRNPDDVSASMLKFYHIYVCAFWGGR